MLGGGSEGYFPAFQLPGVDFSLMASVELGEVSSLPVTAASEKQMQPLQQLSTKEKQLGKNFGRRRGHERQVRFSCRRGWAEKEEAETFGGSPGHVTFFGQVGN